MKGKKLQSENVDVEKPSVDPKIMCDVLEEDVDVLTLHSTPIVITGCIKKKICWIMTVKTQNASHLYSYYPDEVQLHSLN